MQQPIAIVCPIDPVRTRPSLGLCVPWIRSEDVESPRDENALLLEDEGGGGEVVGRVHSYNCPISP